MIRTFLAASTLALATAWPVTAHHGESAAALESVSVSHAWTAETSALAHAIEVYMTIENDGDEAVTLTGAEVDFADEGVFQAQAVADDGTLATRDVSAIEIAPGQSVTLQPGGLRVVFGNVQRELDAGEHFHAHLEFEGLGELEIEVNVDEPDHRHDEHQLG